MRKKQTKTNKTKMKSKIDPYHANVIASYFKVKEDFLNIIQVKKDFQFVLDRFRINPIPVTKETKNIFQCLDTQQIFRNDINEIILDDIEMLQYNYEVSYSEYLRVTKEHENQEKDYELKFKKIVYTSDDFQRYGNVIPPEVNIIHNYCFSNSTFESFVIPTTIKKLSDYCFQYCENLTSIEIPSSVTYIGESAFSNCTSLVTVYLSTNIVDLSNYAFHNCQQLKNINVPPYLKSIGSYCFQKCAIEEMDFPESFESIGDNCFENCHSLKRIDLSIAFQVEDIFPDTFKNCYQLTEILLPSNLKTFNKFSFENCTSLETIVIPSSTWNFGYDCFKNCSSLKELIIQNEDSFIQGQFIEGCTSLTKIELPLINGYCSYLPSENEKEILERNGIPCYSSIKNSKERTELKSLEFMNNDITDCKLLDGHHTITSIYLPSTITSLKKDSFQFFSELKNLIIPKNISRMEFSFPPLLFIKCDDIKFSDGKTSFKEKVPYKTYSILKRGGIHCENVKINNDQIVKLPTDCNLFIKNCDLNNENLLKEIPSNIIELCDWKCLDKTITSLIIPSTVKYCIINSIHPETITNLVELKCYKHHVQQYHLIDIFTNLTKIEIIDGSLDDIVVSYDYHLKMKEKGILLNNVDYINNDREKYGKKLPDVVKSINDYLPEKYDLKESTINFDKN